MNHVPKHVVLAIMGTVAPRMPSPSIAQGVYYPNDWYMKRICEMIQVGNVLEQGSIDIWMADSMESNQKK